MGLGIEEDLGVAHALAAGPGQVGPGQVIEVLFLAQYAAARVIDVEEGLQVAKNVGPANLLDGGIRQVNVVASSKLEHQIGLDGALDVQMKLGLWYISGEIRRVA